MCVCIRRECVLPRLSPSGPRSIRHSSICPYGENISRMSFSLHFLEIIPMNSFLSSTAAFSTKQHQTHLLCVKVNAIQHSTCTFAELQTASCSNVITIWMRNDSRRSLEGKERTRINFFCRPSSMLKESYRTLFNVFTMPHIWLLQTSNS